VTGVGPGSAEGLNKGVKDRNMMGVEKLIGPRVVAAGVKHLVQGDTSEAIVLPNYLPAFTPASIANYTPENDYIVYVRATTNTASVAKNTWNTVTDASDSSDNVLKGITITLNANAGGSGDDVDWVIMKVGN
jgi:hypothetical protein